MAISTETTLNGVDTEQLHQLIENVQQQPELGRAQFRVRNRWIGGGLNRSAAQSFFIAGREDDTRAQPHTIEADEPPVLLGKDQAPNPVEFVLHALAACLTTSMVYHAAARGIRIESVESQLEGDLDTRGFMGLAPEVRKGYQNIRVSFRVKSDAPAEQLKDLCQFSPVFDTIRNPVAVSIDVQKT